MLKPLITLRAYSRIVWVCLLSLYAIIVTGSLVRLTGSGLGCQDWPRCSDRRFIDVSTTHAAIEQINRLFTGVVAFAVIAAALLSLRLRPRQSSLTWLALGLVAGVMVQVLLGAIVVISGLHPGFNMAHYLVSILLISTAFEMLCRVRRLRQSDTNLKAAVREKLSTSTRNLIGLLMVFLCLILIAGTVVTGSGPHAGDETAPRFQFSIQTVTQIHGATVWLALLTVVVLFVRIRRSPFEWQLLSRGLETLTVVMVAQGFLGYLQYFAGVPAGLVAIHVGVSVAVWIAALNLLNTARISVTWRQFVLD